MKVNSSTWSYKQWGAHVRHTCICFSLAVTKKSAPSRFKSLHIAKSVFWCKLQIHSCWKRGNPNHHLLRIDSETRKKMMNEKLRVLGPHFKNYSPKTCCIKFSSIIKKTSQLGYNIHIYINKLSHSAEQWKKNHISKSRWHSCLHLISSWLQTPCTGETHRSFLVKDNVKFNATFKKHNCLAGKQMKK